MIIKKGIRYLIAYGMWVITLLMGLWFCYLSWQGFHKLLVDYYVRGSYTYATRASLYEKVFIVVIGLLWAFLMIISEEYFRRTALTDKFWGCVAKTLGPVLLATFLADGVLLLLNGIQNSGWLRWIILIVELACGLALTLYARSAKTIKLTKETR